MIATSHYSMIPLPVSDKYSQLLPRRLLWDGKTAQVPPPAAQRLRGAAAEHPARVPELTLPSHGSREPREGRVARPELS